MASSTAAIPPAFSLRPTNEWDGNDGNWSTFRVSVGTPGQDFRVLVSTRGGFPAWVPAPNGCTGEKNPEVCASLRGVEPYNSGPSPGFQNKLSQTWDGAGLYKIQLEADLDYRVSGAVLGFDTVRLGYNQDTQALMLENGSVAALTVQNYYMGLIGVSTAESEFSTTSEPAQSMLSRLKNNSEIPSLSYGYTAGAYYRYKKIPGNLILGGYDQSRFESFKRSNFSFATSDADRSLVVGVQSIRTNASFTNPDNSMYDLAANYSHLSAIDSTVPELWLPENVCDTFADAFNLAYDNDTGRYLVDETTHDKLINMNPTLTFQLGREVNVEPGSVSIALPYAAFDLYIGSPVYPIAPHRYFPIRRANESSRYTIGRVLLQEAYLIVDHDRKNFSLAPATFSDPMPDPDIQRILSPGMVDDSMVTSQGLSGGAKAGIAIGVVFGILFLVGVLFLCWWRPRRRRHNEEEKRRRREASITSTADPPPIYREGKPYDPWVRHPSEQGEHVMEMSTGAENQARRPELDGSLVASGSYELPAPADDTVHEMDASAAVGGDTVVDGNRAESRPEDGQEVERETRQETRQESRPEVRERSTSGVSALSPSSL